VIDYDFEERLVDRIAAREAIAARLTSRQRHVLSRCYRYGETYREVGARDGVSATRINQIHDKAVRSLRRGFAAPPKIAAVAPTQTTRDTPPPGFDRAAFLRHMRGLIAKREEKAREQRARDEEEARNWRKRERDALDQIMRNEEVRGLFDPPPPQKPKLPPPPPIPQPQWQPPSLPAGQNVEPWFDLSRQPTLGDLRCIAQYALGYFVAVRRPTKPGSLAVGGLTTRVVCLRDADMVATALQQVRVEIPATARLSAALLDVPEGLLAVTLGCPFVALRVASVEEGKQVSIEVTWDHAA
jgi:Sigma-70, region 4